MADTTPQQGSTVQDAANAFEHLLTEEESPTTEAPAAAAEIPQQQEPEPEPAQDDGDGTEVEAEEPEPEPEAPPLYTVKVDGEERQVPIDELVKGYQFGADYTRKTQKLAEVRKATEQELQSVREERALYSQLLPAMKQALETQGKPPDFDALYQQDPVEAIRQERAYRQKQELLSQAQAEQQRIQSLQQQEHQQGLQQHIAQEAERLLAAIPEWKDPAKAAIEKKELIQVAMKSGFTEDEVSNVIDHRAVIILRKAALYDKMQSAKATLRPSTPAQIRPAKPGNSERTGAPTTEVTKAKQRLAKTGNIHDAASAIEQML